MSRSFYIHLPENPSGLRIFLTFLPSRDPIGSHRELRLLFGARLKSSQLSDDQARALYRALNRRDLLAERSG